MGQPLIDVPIISASCNIAVAYSWNIDKWLVCKLAWLCETSVLVYMISSDATIIATRFKFINCTRSRACGHADIHVRSHARSHETED